MVARGEEWSAQYSTPDISLDVEVETARTWRCSRYTLMKCSSHHFSSVIRDPTIELTSVQGIPLDLNC